MTSATTSAVTAAPRTVRAWLLVVCLSSLATPALAQRRGYIDGFVGWSPDGSFYVMTTSGTDEMDVPVLCLSDRRVGSRSWPKEVPLPAKDDPDGCTPRWDEMFPDGDLPADEAVAKAKKWTTSVRSEPKGPNGEGVLVRAIGSSRVAIEITRAGRSIATASLPCDDAHLAVPRVLSVAWRRDGGAVAVVLGRKRLKREVGSGPPRFLVVLPLVESGPRAHGASSRWCDGATDVARKLIKPGELARTIAVALDREATRPRIASRNVKIACDAKYADVLEIDFEVAWRQKSNLESSARILWRVSSKGQVDADWVNEDAQIVESVADVVRGLSAQIVETKR